MEELAEEQYGIVTRAQAHAYLSDSAIDRRLARRRWIPVFPGVYRVSGAPVTARQRALAVVLWAGKGAVLSHLAAGRLLRLDGIPRPLWLDVTVDRSTGLTAPEVVVHRAALVRSDRVVVDGIPCTNAARTLIDCAPFVDAEIIETAFEAARRSGLASVRSVAQRLAQGRPGSAAMRSVLERVEA
ncbi:MAG TPA: hypothetical protein VN636_17260, partial [Acidimicrobiia bacterium]|nr:hypothetical protein [Acidimicrobiia bacterium]